LFWGEHQPFAAVRSRGAESFSRHDPAACRLAPDLRGWNPPRVLPAFTLSQWLLALFAAFCIGFSKSGFAGVGLVTVVVMARLFPPRESTGILLPLLIVGDIMSVAVFHQHARWSHIWRLLPPTVAGILAGYFIMQRIPNAVFGPVIGVIVLVMVILQIVRKALPGLYANVPHTRGFGWLMGAWSGVATMLANAAGPVMALYFLARNIAKYEFVGTTAWFFLLVNVFKVPFSARLGLIHPGSLFFDLVLIPAVALGIWAGRRLVGIVPQALFEQLLLFFAAVAALRLIGLF
jgi:uncharacterized protein